MQLCPNNNIASDPDQSCFEQYQLQVILDRNDPIAGNDYKKHFLHNTLQIPRILFTHFCRFFPSEFSPRPVDIHPLSRNPFYALFCGEKFIQKFWGEKMTNMRSVLALSRPAHPCDALSMTKPFLERIPVIILSARFRFGLRKTVISWTKSSAHCLEA